MQPAREIISTKANTLYAMKNLITHAKIEKMYILRVRDYWQDKERVCKEIQERFEGCRIVVRSSSSHEDCLKSSNAGHYKSILDVDSASLKEIEASVDEVIASYEEDMDSVTEEQVLIQRQATHVQVSGVIFTRDLRENRPYYLVNFDDLGSTDRVTSGRGGKMLWIARDVEPENLAIHWQNLITAVREVEGIIEGIPLDIEFAINSKHEVILFQVRPLAAANYHTVSVDEPTFYACKRKMKKAYEEQKDVLSGEPMKLSDMAFWNPSEIIGSNPPSLDYSLYRRIITHRAWNEGIRQLGYCVLDEDLMYRIGNKPYINLNYSFYSLIPEALPKTLNRKLVNYYHERLQEDLSAHDKIEFEIVFSSYDFMTERNSYRLLEHGFTEEERQRIVAEVKKLTLDAINRHQAILTQDTGSINILEFTRMEIEKIGENCNNVKELIETVKWLLEAITRYGTPQFARQARMAFMARAFIRTLVEAGYYSQQEMDQFMQSISTVSTKFNEDFEAYADGIMSKEEFDSKYGHLRSGTYDIQTERYDAMNFRPVSAKSKQPKRNKNIEINLAPMQQALNDHGINLPAEAFQKFLITEIEQREYFKFEFTRSLSQAIEWIRKIGQLMGFRLDELSWLTIEDFEEYNRDLDIAELKENWNRLIEQRYQEFRINRSVLLPEVVVSSNSIDIIPVYEARPNYITSKRVAGEVVLLEEDHDTDITGKIVVVPQADPGYEWIFTKQIKGFITKYGGAASHMAIRCAEFDIPAAIGCGAKIYDTVSKLDYLELDCQNGTIQAGIQYTNLHALITQREGVNQYGDATDILESAYIRFYELMGFIPKPVSNHTKNFERLFDDDIDLLIVVGGGALDPKWYDREHEEEIQPNRDRTEEKMIKYCVEHGIPIVATCRGMQYINVLYGGKLHYHPDLPVNRPRGRDHKVHLIEENRDIYVNNFHQDVIFEGNLAPCFKPLAVDEENHVIEAYYSEEMKLLGLQWHPERQFETSGAEEETRRIIVNFIQRYIH